MALVVTCQVVDSALGYYVCTYVLRICVWDMLLCCCSWPWNPLVMYSVCGLISRGIWPGIMTMIMTMEPCDPVGTPYHSSSPPSFFPSKTEPCSIIRRGSALCVNTVRSHCQLREVAVASTHVVCTYISSTYSVLRMFIIGFLSAPLGAWLVR